MYQLVPIVHGNVRLLLTVNGVRVASRPHRPLLSPEQMRDRYGRPSNGPSSAHQEKESNRSDCEKDAT